MARKFVPKIALPVVLDADALIPSLTWPDSCIATPHRKEMMRLLGKDNVEEKELLSLTQDFCDEKKIVIVLKGAPTWVFVPSVKPFIVAHGDPGMATVPTTAEQGMPELRIENWYGMVAPAATPPAIVAALNKIATEAMRDPAVREKLASQGAELIGDSPEHFRGFIQTEIAKWAKVIKDAGIEPAK